MKGSLEEKLECTFYMYSIEGSTTRTEMVEIVRSIYITAGSVLNALEEETDAERLTEQILGCAGRSQSGIITLEDFIEGSKRHPVMTKLLTAVPWKE